MSRLRLGLVCPLLLLGALAVYGLSGCSSGGDDEVAKRDKYEVIEGDADADASSTSGDASTGSRTESEGVVPPADPTASSAGTVGSTGVANGGTGSAGNAGSAGNGSATSTPSDSGAGSASGASPAGGRSTAGGSSSPPRQPPSLPAEALNSYEVPDGTPQQMLDFIASVDASVREMTTAPVPPEQRELVRERIRQAFIAKEKAATKAYAEAKKPEIKFVAAQAKLESLLALVGLNEKGVTDRVVAFANSLASSPDKRLVQQGRQLLVSIEVGKLSSGEDVDVDALLASFETLLNEGGDDASLVDTVQNTVAVLNATGKVEQALKLLDMAARKFQQSNNPDVARIGRNFAQQVSIQSLDFPKVVSRVMQDDTPAARQAYLETLDKIKQIPEPGEAVLYNLTQALQPLEYTGHFDLCRTTCDVISEIFGNHPEEQLRNVAKRETEIVLARINMIGKPLAVEGMVTIDGKPFDWQTYRGKVVLIDFWLARAQAWERQLPEFKKIYDEFHPLGFEIIGVSLDADPNAAQAFLRRSPLPWPIVRSADPNVNALAEKCRVQSVPFTVLIDAKGNVADLYATPKRLREHLTKMLNPASASGDEKAANEKPPANTKDGKTSRWLPSPDDSGLAQMWFVSTESFPEPPAESEPGDTDEELPAATGNPYAAAPDAKPQDLVVYLLEMADKPKSIRARPAFRAAMVDAAQRLLDNARNDRDRRVAATALLEWLHEMAFDGDAQADARLAEVAAQLQNDQQAAIADVARLYVLEQRALKSGDLDPAAIPALLDDLFAAFGKFESLDARHLRTASATVRAINQLEDSKARDAQFKRFGELFAGSRDVALRAYGKKLAKPPAGSSALVGKPLELEGTSDLGTPFDWKAYRGKWVLVDFWATWCGPCRREMPKVKALYEKWKTRGFDVVGVNLDKDPKALAEFLKQNPLPWAQLVDEGAMAAAQAYNVRGIPTMMLIDPDGNIVAVSHQVDALRPELEKRLAKQ